MLKFHEREGDHNRFDVPNIMCVRYVCAADVIENFAERASAYIHKAVGFYNSVHLSCAHPEHSHDIEIQYF